MNPLSVYIRSIALVLCVAVAWPHVAFAAQTPTAAPPDQTAILAPEGLEARERANLEQQYRFQYRNKQRILHPDISSRVAGWVPVEDTMRQETEDEKLYRYFLVAQDLYKQGRCDEAVEVMGYVASRKPQDGYVQYTLQQMKQKATFGEKRWGVCEAGKGNQLRSLKVKNLFNEGVSLYKQQRYDDALLRFVEILEIEPDNYRARFYYDKLKRYYLREVKVDNTVTAYTATEIAAGKATAGKPGTVVQPKNRSSTAPGTPADKALEMAETKMHTAADRLLDAQADKSARAEQLLDEKEMHAIISEKKLAAAMDEGEAAIRVQEIVEMKKAEAEKEEKITLGGGDAIVVIVEDHPELSGRVPVTFNGEIVLPLVNETVNVNDLTEKEAAAKIAEIEKKYVENPTVQVLVEAYGSKMFYVVDDLGCTPYPITRPNLTLRDALFISDWGDNRALGRVIVMKPNKGNPVVKKVDCFDLIYRGNLKNNMLIENGDVIYIPLTVAAKVTKVLADTLAPFNQIKAARDEWINLNYHRYGYENWFRMPVDGADQQQLEVFGGNTNTN